MTAASDFIGTQRLAGAGEVEAFAKRAASGERLIYCEAPDLIRGPTASLVTVLAGDGLVTPHRQRRDGGGFNFLIIRTGKPWPKPGAASAVSIAPDSVLIG